MSNELEVRDPFETSANELFQPVSEINEMEGFDSLRVVFLPENSGFRGSLIGKGAPELIDEKPINTWIVETKGVRVRLGGSILLDKQMESIMVQYELPCLIVVKHNGYKNIGNGRRVADIYVFAKGDKRE